LLFGEGIGMMYRNNVRVLLTPATTLWIYEVSHFSFDFRFFDIIECFSHFNSAISDFVCASDFG
jgi:hypothetical protein